MRKDLQNSEIIFYDGVCGLCNRFVNFIINLDKKHKFLFAALQGDLAKDVNIDINQLDSIVYYSKGNYYFRSEAVIRILSEIPSFRWIRCLLYLPLPLRDFAYRQVATRRYKIFGRFEQCLIPDESIKKRFIE